MKLFFKNVFYVCMLLSLFSCSVGKVKESESEDQAYARIKDLRSSERFILSAELSESYIEKFPESARREELELYINDQYADMLFLDTAVEKYKEFLTRFPNSSKKEEVRKKIAAAEHEKTLFHKHLDFWFFLGTTSGKSGDISSLSKNPRSMVWAGLSAFFAPNHGAYFGSLSFNSQGNASQLQGRSKAKTDLTTSQLSVGYLYRWKLRHQWNLVYGIGIGRDRTYLNDNKDPYKKIDTFGGQQFLTIDYCAYSMDYNLCWNGLFPSIGIFHRYSPNGAVGSRSTAGHLFGIGLGIKI